MVSIKEVAKLAKVSMMTVSRVVNETGYVKKETRERILKIIKETGYEVNQTAVGLRTGTANSIGVIISDISNPYFPPMIKAIDDVFSKNNYDTILFNSAEDREKELRYIALLKSKSVKGLLISSCISNYEKNKDVFSGLLPVFFNRKPEGIEADVIINDDHKMLFASTEHLINLGHKKIAFVNGPLELSSFNFRQKGYLDAMSKYKLPVNEELIINGDFSIKGGYVGIKRIFNAADFPDAILFGNNLLTRGAFIYIKEKNINIPEELSLIGHGDYEWCSIVEPSLTVSECDRYEMGYIAAEVLLKRLNQGNSDTFQEIVTENKIIIRNSVKSKL